VFKEGIDGFKGGPSTDHYISISKTSRATATRNAQDLVEKGALTKVGELRYTRYFVNINERSESWRGFRSRSKLRKRPRIKDSHHTSSR
jgi:hypothetical protein